MNGTIQGTLIMTCFGVWAVVFQLVIVNFRIEQYFNKTGANAKAVAEPAKEEK